MAALWAPGLWLADARGGARSRAGSGPAGPANPPRGPTSRRGSRVGRVAGTPRAPPPAAAGGAPGAGAGPLARNSGWLGTRPRRPRVLASGHPRHTASGSGSYRSAMLKPARQTGLRFGIRSGAPPAPWRDDARSATSAHPQQRWAAPSGCWLRPNPAAPRGPLRAYAGLARLTARCCRDPQPMLQKIGKYRILDQVGRGGMGTVYRAYDPVLDRTVALKVISGEGDVTDELRARFFREAQACARLSHPNIITVHDLGEEDRHLFIVMEYLEGEELKQVIAQRRLLSLEAKLALMVQVCAGLDYAHQKGIVHRDIKPGNIFVLKSGAVKVLDFGIARIATATAGLTRTGLIMGTLRYMSPEQARGRVDHRSDIFSAGAVFYELLTNQLPFPGEDPMQILEQLRSEDPLPPAEVDPAIPAELSGAIQRALQKDPDQRFSSFAELRVSPRCRAPPPRGRVGPASGSTPGADAGGRAPPADGGGSGRHRAGRGAPGPRRRCSPVDGGGSALSRAGIGGRAAGGAGPPRGGRGARLPRGGRAARAGRRRGRGGRPGAPDRIDARARPRRRRPGPRPPARRRPAPRAEPVAAPSSRTPSSRSSGGPTRSAWRSSTRW